MTDLEYRRLQRIANSDLTELLAIKTGKPLQKAEPKTLQFGTTFHQMILEPEKPVDWNIHHVTERAKLLEMHSSFLRWDPYWFANMHLFETEMVVDDAIDDNTGVALKAKLDLFNKQYRWISDVKTTSCRSSQDFFDTFTTYGYDRQAAFYLDIYSVKGYKFKFIGIQKVKPYDVFVIDMSISDDRRRMIDEGRRKNAQLLKVAKRELENPNGWRPSSWSR
ncbi:hypothetical protein GCM10027347_52350 [Larkinella harenae]